FLCEPLSGLRPPSLVRKSQLTLGPRGSRPLASSLPSPASVERWEGAYDRGGRDARGRRGAWRAFRGNTWRPLLSGLPVASGCDMATIIFDLDGTLVDTALDLIDALNETLRREGLPIIPYDEARSLIGWGARSMLERGLAAVGRPAAEIDCLYEHFIA